MVRKAPSDIDFSLVLPMLFNADLRKSWEHSENHVSQIMWGKWARIPYTEVTIELIDALRYVPWFK